MRCPSCRAVISDRDLARYLAAKGGRARTPRKLAAVRATLEKINVAPGQVPPDAPIPTFGITGNKRRFATMEAALKWHKADQERRKCQQRSKRSPKSAE